MPVRKIFMMLILILGLAVTSPATASFLFEEPILTQDAIGKLDDKALIDTYTNVIIEEEAVKTFYENSGFSNPQEYRHFKELLHYKINLITEIEKRKLNPPKLRL